MISYWEQNYWNNKVDFVVIGAGFTGLNTALHLKAKAPKAKVVVLDGNSFRAASTKNAGFACYGSPSELLSNIESLGEEKATQLLIKRKEGIAAIAKIASEANIDFKPKDGLELFFDEHKLLLESCQKNLSRLNGLTSESLYDYAETPISSKAQAAISIKGEAQLNPFLLSQYLKTKCQQLGVEFLTEDVKTIGQEKLLTSHGFEMSFKQAFLCTNAFAEAENEEVVAVRNQVLISRPFTKMPYTGTYHVNEGFIYFRNVGDRLLIGGARGLKKEQETTAIFGENEEILDHLYEFAKNRLGLSQWSVEQKWSGILGMRKDKMPKIERDESRCLNAAVGMSGMGVALSFVLSKEMVNSALE